MISLPVMILLTPCTPSDNMHSGTGVCVRLLLAAFVYLGCKGREETLIAMLVSPESKIYTSLSHEGLECKETVTTEERDSLTKCL